MKTCRKSLPIIAAVCLALGPIAARANVIIELQLGSFYEPDGTTLIPFGSVGVLVADTTGGGFLDIGDLGGLSTSSGTLWGDHLSVLGAFTFGTDVDSGISGFFGNTPAINLTGGLNSGDQLAFYWFPEITSIGDAVSTGMSWGFYRNSANDDNSGSEIGFIMPGDGSNSLLASFDDTIAPGSLPSVADFTTTAGISAVPEPSTGALLAGLAGLAGAAWHRRRQAAA